MYSSCRNCQSSRILRDLRMFAVGLWLGPRPIVLHGSPASLTGSVQTNAVADVCVDCGDVRLRTQDLAVLQKAYARLGGDPEVRLNL